MNTKDPAASGALICRSVYLLAGQGECYACKKITKLFAVMALPPFQAVGEQDDVMDDEGSMLTEIADMPGSLGSIAGDLSNGKWRLDYSRTAGETYWINHCEWCDAKQGDFFVLGANGPFAPFSEEGQDAIEATKVEGPHRFASANTSYSGAMADWRDRRHGVVKPPIKLRRTAKRK